MKALVLCSGGIKSAFLVGMAKREENITLVEALWIDHGQINAEQEFKATAAICQYYSAHLNTISLNEGVKFKEWLPFSFTLLLWHGCMFARKNNFQFLYYGTSRDDNHREKGMEYLKYLQQLIDTIQPKYDTDGFMIADRLQIEAPLLLLTLPRILFLGTEFNIPWNLTWSCENAGSRHCGICDQCLRRKKAFQEVTALKSPIVDSAHYSHTPHEVLRPLAPIWCHAQFYYLGERHCLLSVDAPLCPHQTPEEAKYSCVDFKE